MDNNNPIDQKARDTIDERIKDDKTRVIEAARDSLTIANIAAKSGISRPTIYRWEKEDLEFKKQLKEALLLKLETARDGGFLKFAKYIADPQNDPDWRAQLSFIKYTEGRMDKLGKDDESSEETGSLDVQTIEALGELLIAASKNIKEKDK